MTDEKKEAEEKISFAKENLSYYNKLLEIPEVQEGMRILEEQRPLNLINIKDSCKFELERFINIRGTIDKDTGKIHLPLMTISEQKIASTLKQMKAAQDLILELETANSLDELNDILQTSTRAGDDLDATIGKCLLFTELAKSDNSKTF